MLLKIIKFIIGAVLFLFFLLIAMTLIPIKGNLKALTVQSGSMEPKIGMGSLIFVKPSQNYKAGDIVTFKTQTGTTTVTHRILRENSTSDGVSFVTKGDANEDEDPQETKKENIIGKTFLILPFAGYPVAYAKTKLGFILLILIPSVIIIYEEIRKIGVEIKGKFKKEKKEKVPAEGSYRFEDEFVRHPREKNIAKADAPVEIIASEPRSIQKRKMDL